MKVFLDGGMLTVSTFFSRRWDVSSIYGTEDPQYRGMLYIDEDWLEELVRTCVKHKVAFTAHCQSDAAVRVLVRVYERVNQQIRVALTQSTITHSSFMNEASIVGAARLEIGVDLQPAWLHLDASSLVA